MENLTLSGLQDDWTWYNVFEIAKGNRYAEINNKSYLVHAKNLDKFQYLSEEVETFETFDFVAYIDEHRKSCKKERLRLNVNYLMKVLIILFRKCRGVIYLNVTS